MHEPPPKTETPKLPGWIRWGVLGLVVSVAVVLYMQFSDALSLENLAQQEAQLRDFQSRSPWLVYAVSLLIYITITGLSLPGAAPLTMLFGWYFGVLQGVLLVSFASTTGATLAFLLSRFLFRNSVQNRFGDRLDAFNRALEREGPFYLFSLRLIPAVPFFVINAVMGLTPIRVWTFWWVSQLGMLAGTLVYVYAGSTVPDLATLADQGINAVFSARQLTQILVAFVLLGLFPLISRWIIKRVIGKRAKPPEIKSS
ncbi:MAG: TVP38/TMEM64 family protein [Planctomycetaceae bacterium]|nr:TVP38/TMEM64 family protein [Planctomycetaceae bacterium]